MELAKSFEPHAIEAHWYPEWERRGYFAHSADPASPAYCIQLPPPNVTGTLHMGHAFQQTLMDTLIRYHRMRGFNTNWVAGTDHAGIATQIVVERQLQAEGKTATISAATNSSSACGRGNRSRARPSRARCGAWAPRPTGPTPTPKASTPATSPWTRSMSRAVIEVFVRLHEEGLIYRGKRLVNWDPVLGTAVSDLEVDSEEEDGKIWEIRYPFEDGSGRWWSPPPARKPCSATSPSRSTRRTNATRALVGKQVAAAAHRPHDPGDRRRLRRPANSAPAASRSRRRTISTTIRSASAMAWR